MNKDQTEAIITAILMAGFMSHPQYTGRLQNDFLSDARNLASKICDQYTDL